MRGVDYYELLGVAPSATSAEIKSAYRNLAKIMHPDAGGTAGTFRLLREAYETLNDPVRRAAYDRNSTGWDSTGWAEHAEQPGAESGPESWAEAEAEAEAEPVRPRGPRADRTRGKRAGRGNFGVDHEFVPTLPTLGDIPWLREVEANGSVRYLPTARPTRETVLAAVGGWALLALTVVFPIDLSPLLFALWLVMLVAAAAGVLRLARRHVAALHEERLFAARYGRRTVFGSPEQGQVVERLTADLLADYLTRLPGARIFHGVAWPGSVFADIDHAVLCGRRLVLIESKMWLPGHYTADADGELWRNGHPFRGGGTRLPESIEAYRDLLPGIEVRGALLVYPSRAGQITTGQMIDVPAPPMTPEQFVVEIGAWLAAEPSTIDRETFLFVRRQVVS